MHVCMQQEARDEERKVESLKIFLWKESAVCIAAKCFLENYIEGSVLLERVWNECNADHTL